MAVECSQEAVLNFLLERGGRVKNTELVDHFKAGFPNEPKQKAAVRERFKNYVDSMAFVKTENGVKYVCLKKKFRGENEEHLKQNPEESSGQVSGRDARPASPEGVHSSDYSQTTVPHVCKTLPDTKHDQNECYVCVVEDCSSAEMGNRGSIKRAQRDSKKKVKAVELPVITVIAPIEPPVQEAVFNLTELAQTGNTGQSDTLGITEKRQVTTLEELEEQENACERGSDAEDDAQSLGDVSPKSSREHFIEVMMNSSTQLRRSLVLRNSFNLSRRNSDSTSLASCNIEEDRNSVTLDPLEHEWMLCASDADWGSLQRLLASEPGLILKKDFVSGFTCLHWAAKQGKPELIALIINFAKQHNIPISVDVRSSTGYTPLHIAAMHNHMEVVKLLVGAYNADVEIRDYSGRKACQYLTDHVSVDIQDIIGAYVIEIENRKPADGKRWRFSKALQVKPIRRLNSTEDSDLVDGRAREKLMRRKSSLGGMKPKLQKLRWRTSQLVHSTTSHGAEDLEKPRRGSFMSRPKTHLFS